MSPNKKAIYIFGGINKTNITGFDDIGVYATERYRIAVDEWTVLGPDADLDVIRWSMFSFVSPTNREIYLYGGYSFNENNELQDTKMLSVFSIKKQKMFHLGPCAPEWEKGHYLGLSNTLRVDNLCPNEIGISVGSFDFESNENIPDFQLLRTGDVASYNDNEIIIESVDDIENMIFYPYGDHLFTFTITATTGAWFIPDANPENYDFLVTDWKNITRDIIGMNETFTGKGNGKKTIVTIEEITVQDVGLFNRCNGCTNVVQRIEIQIKIRRSRDCYCGGKRRYLARWPFRDSDPKDTGVLKWHSAVRLEVIKFSRIYINLYMILFFSFCKRSSNK